MARQMYEVLISRRSLAELRKGGTNVIMGVLAKPRGIVGDKSAALAMLTVVEVKNSSAAKTKAAAVAAARKLPGIKRANSNPDS